MNRLAAAHDRLPVLAALTLAGWIAAGLPLLLAGAFRPLPATLLGLGFAGVLIRFVRLPARATSSRPAAVAAGLSLLIALGFGVLAWLTSSEHVVVRRDPGTYALTASWLADHGRLPIPAQSDVFGDVPGLDPSSPGFYAPGDPPAVVPQFMSGTPLALAPAGWLGGLHGITRANAVIGALGLLAVAGLAARLAGPWAGPLAALALALAQPELHAARSAYSEPAAQLLAFGGLALLVDAARAQAAAGAVRRWAGGGLLLGLVALVRIDGLADLLPMIVFAGVVLVTHGRPAARALGAGLAVGVGLGLVDGLVLSRPYLAMLAGQLLAVAAAAVLVLVGTAVGVRHRARLVRGVPARWRDRGPELAAAAVAAAAVLGYTVRPWVRTARISPNAGSSHVVAGLQARLGLPHDPGRTYAEHSLHWLAWYLGVSGLLLGFAGLALLLRRGLRGRAGDPGALPVTLLVLGATALVLWKPSITPDHPWADRRFVPLVLPGLVVGGAWAVVVAVRRLAATGRRGLTVALGAGLVLGLVAPAAWAGAPLLGARTERGEIALVHRLCAALPDDAAVVVVGQRGRKELPQAVRGECGVPVTAATADAVRALPPGLPARVAASGRRLVVLAETRAEAAAALPGAVPRRVVALMTREDDRRLVHPARRTVHLRLDVWLATAP